MTVLVAYIPTPEGEAAAAAGIEEARRRGEPLLVLNSGRDGALVDRNVADEDDLERLTTAARDAGVDVQIILPANDRDDLTREILDAARSNEASVIVIGIRQRSQVGKLLMGSNAQRILLQADRPVLAVKADYDL